MRRLDFPIKAPGVTLLLLTHSSGVLIHIKPKQVAQVQITWGGKGKGSEI